MPGNHYQLWLAAMLGGCVHLDFLPKLKSFLGDEKLTTLVENQVTI